VGDGPDRPRGVVGTRGHEAAAGLADEARKLLLDVANGRVPDAEAAHRLARGWLAQQRGGLAALGVLTGDGIAIARLVELCGAVLEGPARSGGG